MKLPSKPHMHLDQSLPTLNPDGTIHIVREVLFLGSKAAVRAIHKYPQPFPGSYACHPDVWKFLPDKAKANFDLMPLQNVSMTDPDKTEESNEN